MQSYALTPTELYQRLYAGYGDLNWWPAESPFEMMVGAILTQNTAWSNVEKAIANFSGGLTPALIENAVFEDLTGWIRPAGFFNQKAAYLKALTAWYKQYDYSVDTVKRQNGTTLRKELLAVRGIGRETADSILLYAFGFPSFVIDAYTRRLVTRLEIQTGQDYEALKAYFETQLPQDADLYNNYHACIVIHAKTRCRVKPVCTECPLLEVCSIVSS